jgi:hypothetical protein
VNTKGSKIYYAEDPSITPEEMAADYAGEYGSVKMALTGISLVN